MNRRDIPTITRSDALKLLAEGDGALCAWADEFFQREMKPIPTGILDTCSEQAYERWQHRPAALFKVVKRKVAGVRCAECGDVYTPEEAAEPGFECCSVEHLAGMEDGDYEPFVPFEDFYLFLRDTSYYEEVFEKEAGDILITVPGQADDIRVWDEADRDAAEAAAEERNRKWRHENLNGFPWASGMSWLPSNRITGEDLDDAGYISALYVGGEGDWQKDEDFIVAGVDGGGYSYKNNHERRLSAIVAARFNWTVPTEGGTVRITTEESTTEPEEG